MNIRALQVVTKLRIYVRSEANVVRIYLVACTETFLSTGNDVCLMFYSAYSSHRRKPSSSSKVFFVTVTSIAVVPVHYTVDEYHLF
jgi:hypothetical protein